MNISVRYPHEKMEMVKKIVNSSKNMLTIAST
jgi:hypothetical protein